VCDDGAPGVFAARVMASRNFFGRVKCNRRDRRSASAEEGAERACLLGGRDHSRKKTESVLRETAGEDDRQKHCAIFGNPVIRKAAAKCARIRTFSPQRMWNFRRPNISRSRGFESQVQERRERNAVAARLEALNGRDAAPPRKVRQSDGLVPRRAFGDRRRAPTLLQ